MKKSNDRKFYADLEERRTSFEGQVVTFQVSPRRIPNSDPPTFSYQCIGFQVGECLDSQLIGNSPRELSFSDHQKLEHLRQLSQWYLETDDAMMQTELITKATLILKQSPGLRRYPDTLLEVAYLPLPFSLMTSLVSSASHFFEPREYIAFLIKVRGLSKRNEDKRFEAFIQEQFKSALGKAVPSSPSPQTPLSPKLETPKRTLLPRSLLPELLATTECPALPIGTESESSKQPSEVNETPPPKQFKIADQKRVQS